jgi:hypothetical protein
MADTSSYSIEERLVASVWVHERQHTGQTVFQVMAAFRERFNNNNNNNLLVGVGDLSATLYNQIT